MIEAQRRPHHPDQRAAALGEAQRFHLPRLFPPRLTPGAERFQPLGQIGLHVAGYE